MIVKRSQQISSDVLRWGDVMPVIVPVTAPAPVRAYSGFDYVTVDAVHRRVYAAHGGSGRLLVADADTGKIICQVRVGPMHGSAPDPATGDVYTGNGTDRTVSKVDPVACKSRTDVEVAGPIDAINYDPFYHRIYADEDGGNRVFVIDARTMQRVGVVTLPGRDEEYLAVDPVTHVVYQNVPDLTEFVEIDPKTLRVFKTVKTPMLKSNHPLQYDAAYHQIVVGGTNGVLAVYTPAGSFVAQTSYPSRVDQCDLDQGRHLLACAGRGTIAVLRLHRNGAPTMVARLVTKHPIHTLAIDPKTGYIWAVWASANGSGDYMQRFRLAS
jgi:DNA-binding beta-propeller fold protein YncE